MRIHGWIERDNGKHCEFFIMKDGTYEIRADNSEILEDSRTIVAALTPVAAKFMEDKKEPNGWD